MVRARIEIGLEQGKLDYTEVQGEIALVDVNKTFAFSRPPGRDEVAAEIFHREDALESFFRND